MKARIGKSAVVLAMVLYILLSSSRAHAYLDPGTGSMVVQAVIAGIAAVSVSLGIFRSRVASFFGKLFGRKPCKRDRENDEIKG